ncbi:MAG: MBL fold metallo-hydrolase [Lachnospiraceae bacterium]|nr:MBL fold metallo-hydrolase [Candidatus Merdinaster equi]
MKLNFIGADHEVTGSCHYLEACGKNILVDYGMQQGVDVFENVDLPVSASMIDYVLLTHAHVDHSGMLPLLYANGFRGQIFATTATVDLCSIMLRDCAHIQQAECEWKNRKNKRSSNTELVEPAYTMEDADGTIKLLVPVRYGDTIELCDGIKIRFTDIGHLLGSASIEIWVSEEGIDKKIVFSGDIGNKNQPLIKDPIATAEADYVVMESTYGDRLHSKERVDYVKELASVLETTFEKKGNVVIPSFAVGRTQEILYFIRQIKEDKLVRNYPDFPVYVDSPLAVEATGIFQKNIADCFDEEAMEIVRRGINPITFRGLNLAITSDESKMINFDDTPKVIISASGMCEAGRIRHHLKHNLWREECTILFVGYQAVGTLGRMLVDGAEEVKLFGETINVRATIKTLAGLSGHADKNGLIEWLSKFERKPDKVFIVHGEDSVTESFAACLRDEYDYDTYAPYSGSVYDLANNCIDYDAVPVPIAPKKKAQKASDVFARLLAAGQHLLAVIRRNEGGANKDLARFADQITSLADKWDRGDD